MDDSVHYGFPHCKPRHHVCVQVHTAKVILNYTCIMTFPDNSKIPLQVVWKIGGLCWLEKAAHRGLSEQTRKNTTGFASSAVMSIFVCSWSCLNLYSDQIHTWLSTHAHTYADFHIHMRIFHIRTHVCRWSAAVLFSIYAIYVAAQLVLHFT